jgi:hypothetical protein
MPPLVNRLAVQSILIGTLVERIMFFHVPPSPLNSDGR